MGERPFSFRNLARISNLDSSLQGIPHRIVNIRWCCFEKIFIQSNIHAWLDLVWNRRFIILASSAKEIFRGEFLTLLNRSSRSQGKLNRGNGWQGFCGATFIIGSGLGTLETAANPYLAGKK